MWVKGRRFPKGLGLGNGFGKPGEMEGQREKATDEWGRGGCNSWTGKVNAMAGGDQGLAVDGDGDHRLGLREQVLAACTPQAQPAKPVCVWGEAVGVRGHTRPCPSFLSSLNGPNSSSSSLRKSGGRGGWSLARCP